MQSALQAMHCAPVRARLIALVLATALPLFALSAYLVYSSDSQRQASADLAAVHAADAVSSATSEFLHSAEAFLAHLARRTRVSAGRQFICEFDARDILPAFANAAVFDVDGRVACSAKPFLDREFLTAQGEPWFKAVIAGRQNYLSTPTLGRTNGRWISVYGTQIRNNHGEVVGAVALSIDLATLPPVMRAPGTTAAPIVGLVDQHGTIVARSADPQAWIGQRFAISVNDVLGPSRTKHVVRANGVDSTRRRYGFARVADYPLIAYAGVATDLVDQNRRKELLALSLIALAITTVGSAAAMLIGRSISKPMRSMSQVARAVAAGDHAHQAEVTGPREVREVITEFNRMISVRAGAEADLLAHAARYRTLSKRMLEVEETERRLINRELHDQVGQNLAVLNLTLDGLGGQIRNRAGDDAGTRLAQAQALLETTITQVRDVMGDLRPAALDDYGLFAALQNFARSFSARTGLPINVSGAAIVPRLPSAVETALFRIAQAALVNVAKHAGATSVNVGLTSTRGITALVIDDDGVGFDREKAEQQPSWGLTTMRERADAIGAGLRIESGSAGTRVVVVIETASA